MRRLALIVTVVALVACSTPLQQVERPSREAPPTSRAERGPSSTDGAPDAQLIPAGLDADIIIVGASAADEELVTDAVAAFTAADLAVPPLEIEFLDAATDCGGHLGLFESNSRRTVIHICDHKIFVVTHEIAHVWIAVNLDDVQREQYMRVRGLDNWNDWNAPWGERGIEDSAFIIQQNLTMDRVPLTSKTWVARLEAFELLTGRPSPLRARSEVDPPRPAD